MTAKMYLILAWLCFCATPFVFELLCRGKYVSLLCGLLGTLAFAMGGFVAMYHNKRDEQSKENNDD